MRISVTRKLVKIQPDIKRVIPRFFYNGDARGKSVIKCVMKLSEEEVTRSLFMILREFAKRHRSISKVFEMNCDRLFALLTQPYAQLEDLSSNRKMLIGSYFTHEYSIESAAFFNPSIMEDIDQSDLQDHEKRVIISFRAVGEGHISSIVFRRGVLDAFNNITISGAGTLIEEAEIVRNTVYHKDTFMQSAFKQNLAPEIMAKLKEKMKDTFEYYFIKSTIRALQKEYTDESTKLALEKLLHLADSYHEIHFSLDTDISDRVIFPITLIEQKGIEDARFVRFVEEDGSVKYYATYTAYDGVCIQPKLLLTANFYHFKIMPLYGEGAQNKNLALFPRKINGKYVMLSRIDGVNNYIMFSDKLHIWENPQLLQEPEFLWEFTQIGNCGSPIETNRGWLLITHGVGPMRRYCLGATLLQLDDPTIVLGRLKEPLLVPNNDEREGYVPNVLYSCGSIINHGELVIPYGLSDYASGFATITVDSLIAKILEKD